MHAPGLIIRGHKNLLCKVDRCIIGNYFFVSLSYNNSGAKVYVLSFRLPSNYFKSYFKLKTEKCQVAVFSTLSAQTSELVRNSSLFLRDYNRNTPDKKPTLSAQHLYDGDGMGTENKVCKIV